jgi:hypothetical protein
MKRFLFFIIASSFLSISLLGQTTPKTVSMASDVNNSAAFGSNGTLGSDGSAVYYLHWNSTYLYFGWDLGQTNYENSGTSSDMYFVGIDLINDAGSGEAIGNVIYSNPVYDFYVVYENNWNFYGSPVSSGNAFELYTRNSANEWSYISRTNGNDNNTSKIMFDNSNGEVRLRIAWADLGFVPGNDKPIGFTYWNNNSNMNYLWASFPTDNPTNGDSPPSSTLTHKLVFNSTGSGVDPSNDGNTQPLAFVLPIELISFSANQAQGNVLLNWTTASERYSSHFEVEHSTDGSIYESIARLETAGESSVLQNYNFEHTEPVSGLNYYRLAHYDLDGTLSYSDVKAVDFGKNTSIKVFPNPVKDILTISSLEDFNFESIEIYDMQGVLVETLNTLGDRNDIELSTNDWKLGIYQVVLLQSDGTISVQNIIKQ